MKHKPIPFFEYPRVFLDDKKELVKIFEDVGTRGAFIMQQDLVNFEKNLAKYVGSQHTIGVGNATDGLELAWMSIGLKDKDEVICCAHTMLATASSIRIAGGIPVPVDIGEDNLIDVDAIENSINDKTVGIMPTQLNGRTCNMEKLMKIASKHNLTVIEDSAQALGSMYNNKKAGTFGHAGVISFFPAKVLGSLGDGGAVITNSEEAYDKIFQLHDHGRDPNGDVKSWGRNSRLDNLQAAILDYRLLTYDKIIKRRRKVAQIYHEHLKDLEELKLPPGPNENSLHFDVYQNYEIQAQRRDDLQLHLNQNNIGTLIQWNGKAIHQWKGLGFNSKLPKVEKFFKECIMLPMNNFVSNEEVIFICNSIKSFYRK
ncbi:DegT/DnrJ/EryC1/StrS family aminotransferase [Alphaproteobacteria bacterium]|nr:DegT/DnrJ/EryC1/StrS family aminotransferase [Alphaproteobacteria bacterium]